MRGIGLHGVGHFMPPRNFGGSAAEWWLVDSVLRVPWGGQLSSIYPGGGAGSGGSDPAGMTFIGTDGRLRVRCDGSILQFRYSCDAVGPALGWQFKIFRDAGSGNYTFIGESQLFTPPGTGTRTLTLDTPIAVRMGDLCGVWLAGHATTPARIDYYILASREIAGNLSVDSAIPTTGTIGLNIEPLGMPPFLVTAGDSWIEGLHTQTSTNWWSGFNRGVNANTGNRITDFAWNVQQSLNPLTFVYQQYAQGGQTWDFIRTTCMPYVVLTKPLNALFLSGGNDIQAGFSVATIMADVQSCFDAINWACEVWLVEVAPGNAYDDTEAALVRDLNVALAAFCVTNGCHLIPIHDALGAIRGTTGQLDNLAAIYNDGSGAHTTLAGVALVSGIIKDALIAYYS